MKLHLEVEPNSFNENGFHVVIYRTFLCFKFEVGRSASIRQLNNFLGAYWAMHGKAVSHDDWKTEQIEVKEPT